MEGGKDLALGASDRIVVAGCALGGLRTIEALRHGGHEGEIVAVSAERDWPYDRPPLSKQFLKREWDEEKLSLRRQGFDGLGVSWRLGRAVQSLDAASHAVTLADGERLDYRGLVIATGASPRRLPTAEGLAGVHVLRGLDDARALRDDLAAGGRLVVVGAGFIGMEVAASARQLGHEVVVVETLDAPLMRGLGRTLGDFVAARHRSQGVEIRCGVAVEGFDGGARVEAVKLSDGSVVQATNVLVGIGVVPETGWLEGSGLDIENGVLCDATGATALEDVVAVGDCARWHNPRLGRAVRYEHWTSAVEQAGVAAARLLGGEGSVPPLTAVPYVWSDQFDMRIAITGEPAEGDTLHVTHGTLDDDRFVALFGKADKLVGAVAVRRPRQLNTCRTLIERDASFAEGVAALA